VLPYPPHMHWSTANCSRIAFASPSPSYHSFFAASYGFRSCFTRASTPNDLHKYPLKKERTQYELFRNGDKGQNINASYLYYSGIGSTRYCAMGWVISNIITFITRLKMTNTIWEYLAKIACKFTRPIRETVTNLQDC